MYIPQVARTTSIYAVIWAATGQLDIPAINNSTKDQRLALL